MFANNRQRINDFLLVFWPVIIGLLCLVIPTYVNLAKTVWAISDQAHGPIVLLVVLYLFYDKRAAFALESKPSPFFGWLLFICALLLYVIGRSQDIVIMDMFAQIVILASLVLLFKGWGALMALWFPLFFMLFMVPLPGFLVDAITMPMKIAVSTVSENILYWFNYPVARNGVILQVGQYQLLVADACAGMHTLISLEALGLLYLSLVKHDSLARNIVLALFIIPISFTANTIRVMAIALITFYFGDEVGQGFVHGFAGIVLFIVALVLIITIDSMIQKVVSLQDQK